MAYEISEGAAAGALFLDPTILGSMSAAKTEEGMIEVMKQIHKNLNDPSLVNQSAAEKERYSIWFDPEKVDETEFKMDKAAKLTAVVQGCSAALGIRQFMKEEGDAGVSSATVYITGATWDTKIAFLKKEVGGWKDYNSSDLVVVKGNCYYGISLKKKEKETSANPTMINKSYVELLKSSKMEVAAEKFWVAREEYFGKLVQIEMTRGALKGSNSASMTHKELFNTKVWSPFGNKWVYLIDLKGKGKLKLKKGKFNYDTRKIDEETCILGANDKAIVVDTKFKNNKFVRRLFGYTETGGATKNRPAWIMRGNVNKTLGNIKDETNIWHRIQKIATDMDLATTVGEYLVSAILKTELQGAKPDLMGKIRKGDHFGFALITAYGAVKINTAGVSKITSAGSIANVKSNPTIQQAISNLATGLKGKKWRIRIAEKETKTDTKEQKNKEESTPAKIFFDIGVGNTGDYKKLLNLNIRYKGSFVSSPQFQGGISEALEDKILELKDKKLEYKFTAACKK